MGGDHVPDRAGLLVERPAAFDPDLLGHRDLHVVHVPPVPDGLEHPVGEPEGQDVLDGLLPQVVIDPEDLSLVEHAVQLPVQLPGGLEVPPERLLDHDLRAPVHPGLLEPLHDRRIGGGGRGAVEEPSAVRPLALVDRTEVVPQVLHGVLAVELPRHVGKARAELVPFLAVGRTSPDLGDRVAGLVLELLVGQLAARVPDDGEPVREQALAEQVEEGGEQLPLRQVARGAEDHHRLRVGRLDRHQRAPPGTSAASFVRSTSSSRRRSGSTGRAARIRPIDLRTSFPRFTPNTARTTPSRR